jgi:hypothetical protein
MNTMKSKNRSHLQTLEDFEGKKVKVKLYAVKEYGRVDV